MQLKCLNEYLNEIVFILKRLWNPSNFGIERCLFTNLMYTNLMYISDFLIVLYSGRRLYQYDEDDFGFPFGIILSC